MPLSSAHSVTDIWESMSLWYQPLLPHVVQSLIVADPSWAALPSSAKSPFDNRFTKVTASGEETEKSDGCVPPIATCSRFSGPAPVFVTVNVWNRLPPSTITLPKSVPSASCGDVSPSLITARLVPSTSMSGIAIVVTSCVPELPLVQ
ncbi:MAG: hypothetical protein BWY59_00142 [Verrucomicrobia bacterium ADurb.Bin345]|nr:MAG: hypothetical protein BWY59_00142 [Verrucomicrobia bacterium ADurb.Bin345]